MADAKVKYNAQHYKLLMQASRKNYVSEWNDFVKELRKNGEVPLLEGATLFEAQLEGANLRKAHLEGATLFDVQLQGADLREAHLEGANLLDVQLQGADLSKAHLEGATLQAKLQGANLNKAHLEGTTLFDAQLQGAGLIETQLQGAYLLGANLEGASLWKAHLEGANLSFVICDGQTLISECHIGHYKKDDNSQLLTNFRGVGLDNIRFSPGLKQSIEYFNRRLNWEEWYQKHPLLKIFVRLFWWFSDYGRSTSRIIISFLALSLLFACAYCWIPDVIQNVACNNTKPPSAPYHWTLRFLRSLYFSIITMTTLGFGDISANPINPAGDLWLTVRVVTGYFALMLQVILGYVILGALVTRLSIIFNSDGPAASFSEKEKLGWCYRLKRLIRRVSDNNQELISDED